MGLKTYSINPDSNVSLFDCRLSDLRGSYILYSKLFSFTGLLGFSLTTQKSLRWSRKLDLLFVFASPILNQYIP